MKKNVKIGKAQLYLTRFITNYAGLWGIENDLEKRNIEIFCIVLMGHYDLHDYVAILTPIIAGNGLETWQSFLLYAFVDYFGG